MLFNCISLDCTGEKSLSFRILCEWYSYLQMLYQSASEKSFQQSACLTLWYTFFKHILIYCITKLYASLFYSRIIFCLITGNRQKHQNQLTANKENSKFSILLKFTKTLSEQEAVQPKKSKIVKNFTNYDWTNHHFCERITLGCQAYSSEVIQQTSEIYTAWSIQ